MDDNVRLRDELTTTARQLRRMLDCGAISQQLYDQVAAVIRADLASLQPPIAPPPIAPPAPVVQRASPQPAAAENASAEIIAAKVIAAEIVNAEIVEPRSTPPRPVHPLDRPDVPSPPPRPFQPRQSLAEVVQSFMEESNIRWMEIIAAVCIVISSVGLVWSLRNTLKAIPYFPAGLFALFTLAFHGAGLYTLRKWKLEAVSRVILVIALLLVPLSFAGAIVMAGSGQAQRTASDPLFLAALAMGLAIFGWVSYSGSRELIGQAGWPLAFGVLGCSASQVLIHRAEVAGLTFWPLTLLAGAPLFSFLVAMVAQLLRARRWPKLSRRRINELLLVLGIAAFALAAPLVLLLVRSNWQWSALARLSPVLSLAAAAALALGLLIHRRTTARALAAHRTAGTAILTAAGSLLLLLVALTWPEPELLLAVGTINGAVLAALGIVAELPVLYVPAVACAALAATIGLHLAGGHFAERERLPQRVIEALLMGRTSIALSLLGAAVAGVAVWRRRQARRDEAQMLLLGTGGLAAGAVLISWFSGFVTIPGWQQDHGLSAWMLLLFAAALLAAGSFSKSLQVAAAGSFVLWTALVQALWLNSGIRTALGGGILLESRPVLLATIAHGVLTAGLAALFRVVEFVRSRTVLSTPPNSSEFGCVLAAGAAVSLTIATPSILWVRGDFDLSALLASVAAVGWLLVACSQRWPWALSVLQAMLALAPALLMAAIWKERTGAAQWWLAEGHLYSQLGLFALSALVWSAVRRLTSHHGNLLKLQQPPWPAVDQVLLGLAAVGLPICTLVWAAPLASWELGVGVSTPPAPQALFIGWITFAVILAALAMSLWERVTLPATVGVGIAAYGAVWLGAAHFADTAAVASAARWASAIFAILFAAAFICRQPLRTSAKRLSWLKWSRFPLEAGYWFGAQPLLLGGLTILGITIVAVNQNAVGVVLHGPAKTSIFTALGPTASYAGPLIALVAVLLGYALREKQAGFALGGAALFQLAINLAFVLHVAATPDVAASIHSIEWLQWNSVAAGLYALLWLALSRWITPAAATPREKKLAEILWLVPLGVGSAAAAAISIGAAGAIAQQPALAAAELAQFGHWLSYAAIGLALAAALGKAAGHMEVRGLGDALAWLLAALVPVIAASADRFDPARQFLAYHLLESGWLTIAAAMAALVCAARFVSAPRLTRLSPQHFSAAILAALVVSLAVNANAIDPARPWWSFWGAAGGCAIATALGLARRSQPYALASTGLAWLSMLLLWWPRNSGPGRWLGPLFADFYWVAGGEALVLSVVAAAAFWLWREIDNQQRRSQSFDARPHMPRIHALVAGGIVPLWFLLRLIHGLFMESSQPLVAYDALAAVTVAALGGLLFAALWDRRAVWSLPLSYLWGLMVCCLGVALARPWLPGGGPRLAALVLATAAHAALAGQIWSYGANLAALGSRLGVPEPIAGLTRTAVWLPPLNILLVTLVCLAELSFVLNLAELNFRVAAAVGPAVAAWGLACLAQGRRQAPLQLAALLVAGFSAVLLGWAQLAGHSDAVWMERVFRLLMALAALTFAYGLVLPRLLFPRGTWQAATRRAGYIAGAAAIAAFAVTLGLEASLFRPGEGAPVAAPQVVAIAVVLVGLIAGLISMALLPGRDPLLLSERAKQVYVYAAEATAALLFAHLYLCRPQWFETVLRPYWPFIVMGLAFAGVGAAELLQRLKLRVVAEPLLRTGSLLPLLPVLGMWVAGSRVDYALLLLVAGLMYLALSFTQQSWAAMVAAAAAGNGALWTLFTHSDGFRFIEHPQLWLIPPALSVLAAAQLNRHRLSAEALTAIRYAATIVIYVSSTSEIMIKGLGTSLLPPMILLGLSVAGALAGIALRVRAFLYLGTSFTLVALTGMVWHAYRSIDHVWPLWAFGICLGVALLVVLALFEKNKPEMTAWIGRLRQWEQ